MPLNGVSVAQSIVKRIREKLCQLVFSARRAGVPATLDAEVVEQFIQDLRSRLLKQKNGLRWATMRATAEELYRFSRMIGAPEEEQRRLARLLGECTSRERLQMALKHFAILDSGHTTDTVLDLAESLLTASSSLTTPRKRHRMRNAACIVGLYPVAPLRNASAALVFGQSLFWRNGEWMIETRIQKTAQYNARTFVMPLEPETGRFIDAVVLGDAPIMMLPALREQVQETERPLFVLPDGRPAAPSYIPRVFKAVTGISLTSTRSLLYTDEMNQNGPAGVESARVACHHDPKSRMTDTYRLGSVSVHAVARLRARKSERRRAMLASVSGDARGEN
jgi:hypothetical protein